MRIKSSLWAALAALLASCSDQRVLPTEMQPTLRFTTYSATVAAPFALSGGVGANYSAATDINDLGTIAGFGASVDLLKWETGTTAIPVSLSPTTVGTGKAYAINTAGQIAGWSVLSSTSTATLWTPRGDGTYTVTIVAPSGSMDSEASAINARGQVVGTARVRVGSALVEKCFVWTPTADNATTGSVQELVGLGGGSCIATDINSEGKVVGGSTTASGFQAFVYDGGVTTALQPESSEAVAINDGGQIVGLYGGIAAIWNPVPGGWTTATPLSIPPLSGQSGPIQVRPFDINNAGFVVGFTRSDPGVFRGFIWNSGTVVELPTPDSSSLMPSALTNVVNNQIIVAGNKEDKSVPTLVAMRWTVSLTPVITEGCNERLVRLVGDLKSAGAITAGVSTSLLSKIDAATRQAAAGKTTAAKNIIDALADEINALQASRKLTAAQADSLRELVSCVRSGL